MTGYANKYFLDPIFMDSANEFIPWKFSSEPAKLHKTKLGKEDTWLMQMCGMVLGKSKMATTTIVFRYKTLINPLCNGNIDPLWH